MQREDPCIRQDDVGGDNHVGWARRNHHARLIIDDWRWRRLRPEFRVQGPPVSDDHWNDADAALQSRLVGDALHRLSAKHRDVPLECFYRGCSIDEGAIALDVPEPPPNYDACHDALRTLRLVLAELDMSSD